MLKGTEFAENLFRFLVRGDWLQMRRGSDAYRSAQRALVFKYDLTLFLGGSPASNKTRDAVMDRCSSTYQKTLVRQVPR